MKKFKFTEWHTEDYLDDQEIVFQYLKETIRKNNKELMMMALENVFKSKPWKKYQKGVEVKK